MKNEHLLVRRISVAEPELKAIQRLLDALMQGQETLDLETFLLEAHLRAHELPERIRAEFYAFKLREDFGVICVENNPIDQQNFGPTPSRLPERDVRERIRREEALHLLYCTLLGEPFGWTSIQNGHLVNEVYPIRENESESVSSGSRYDLGLHTEDAFSPFCGDYLGLMCVRNPHNIPTRVSSIRTVKLLPEVRDLLLQPRFRILPNQAHWVLPSDAKVALLYGDPTSPYIRINLNVEDESLEKDPDAKRALKILMDELEANSFDLTLESGDCCFLDNLTMTHGRKAYRPSYDGTDRWMKRIYITSDLRKSRHLRTAGHARIIAPQGVTSMIHSSY